MTPSTPNSWWSSPRGERSSLAVPEARAADEAIIESWEWGDHAAVTDGTPDFMRFTPKGRFGHHLMMVRAVGTRACTAPAEMFSAYEPTARTTQIDIWSDRPPTDWTSSPRPTDHTEPGGSRPVHA